MNKGCLQTIALLFPGLVTLKYHLVFHHLCLYLQLVPRWEENSTRYYSCNIFLSNQDIGALCCLYLGPVAIIHLNQQSQPPPYEEDSKTIITYVKLEQWLCSFSRPHFHLVITYDATWGGKFNGINIYLDLTT